MNSPREQRRRLALLRAFDADGQVVVTESLQLDAYWDESHPLIDSNEYRATRSIARVDGNLFGDEGQLLQHFENRYGSSGEYLGGRIEHEDGTVDED